VSPEEARGRFAQARVARLATAGADGRPHLVPVVFAVVEGSDHHVIYSVVDDKPKRTTALRRLTNVAENPAVSALVDHYEDDWNRLWWVRADGSGRLLADLEAPEAAAAVARLQDRYPQQRAIGTVLAIDVARWSGWAATAAGR
jgi:PPOX class probable F420-dependent enzyme